MSELQQSPETIQTYDLTQIVEAANLLMDAAIMTPSHIQAVFEQISYRIRLRMEGQDTIQQARAAEYEQLLTAWHVMSEIHEQRKQEDQNSISRLIWENYQLRTCLSDTDKHAIFKHNQACDLHDQLSNCTNSINNLKSQIDNNVATIDGLNAMLDSNNDIIANLRLQLVNNTVTINGLRPRSSGSADRGACGSGTRSPCTCAA